MSDTLSPLAALKKYMEADGGRKVSLAELKKLSSEERRELGLLAAEELGVKIESK
ncbi:MAG: hypothetical protein ACYSWU_00305 [Planctomycetota bacterium]|jgi:hypothetical protein